MMKPEKIDPFKNEENIQDGLTWSQSSDLRGIVDMILLDGAFGIPINQKGSIADQIYLDADPLKPKRKYEIDQDRSSTRSKNSDWSTKGRNRFGNLLSKQRRVTYAEADHIFYYFLKFAGPAWNKAITSQDLASEPLVRIIEKGREKGLEWPKKIPGHYLLKSELGAHSNNSSFEICYFKTRTKDIGSSDEMHEPLSPITIYEPGTKVQIHLKNIGNEIQNIFIFLAYDEDYLSDDGTPPSSLRFIQNKITMMNEIRINSPEGGTYRVRKNKGQFCLYALSLPENINFLNEFGFSPTIGKFVSDEDAAQLAKKLKLRMIDNPDIMKIATHPYRV